MPKLNPVSRRELVGRLKALGFEGPYQQGRHPFMVRGNLRVPIPNPHEGDIGQDLLSRILRLAGIRREEWDGLG
jgi:predicted RNA binding protein YcfA (HicA-like mRNA interferase family)